MSPSNRSRKGMTLLELVIAFAIVSVLATVTTRLLHAMLRQQTATTTQLSLASSLNRLTERLRKDAHNASDADIYLHSTLSLAMHSGKSVEWQRENDRLVRTATMAGKPRTEYFDLLPELVHSFDQISIEGTDFIVLDLAHKTSVQQTSELLDATSRDPRFPTISRGSKILVALGRDLQYLKEEAE